MRLNAQQPTGNTQPQSRGKRPHPTGGGRSCLHTAHQRSFRPSKTLTYSRQASCREATSLSSLTHYSNTLNRRPAHVALHLRNIKQFGFRARQNRRAYLLYSTLLYSTLDRAQRCSPLCAVVYTYVYTYGEHGRYQPKLPSVEYTLHSRLLPSPGTQAQLCTNASTPPYSPLLRLLYVHM